MKNGWTGAQYSAYRILFGTYLFAHFVHLAFWGAEVVSRPGLLVAAALSVSFALGKWDRFAAVAIGCVWAWLLGWNLLTADSGLPWVGGLLLAHAFLPSAPFGSLAARGRIDPRGGWTLTPSIYAVAWILLSLGYSYWGYTKLISPSWLDGTAFEHVLRSPLARPTILREGLLAMPALVLKLATWGALGLEILYAPLALSRRARPWIWVAMLLVHLGLLALADFADLTLGMLMIHFFTFDPAWIRAKGPAGPDTVLYDGTCGLCHGTVRFLLAEDTSGKTFRFAPLDSGAARSALSEEGHGTLPDSVVVHGSDGRLFVRSDAVGRILGRLGGLWGVLAWALVAIPGPVRNLGYDVVASVRYPVFGRTKEACPPLPPDYRRRWLA